MSLAPWREPLARALHRNRSQANSRYPQLATVRASGRPANRTVVFRDFLPDTNKLLFVTDVRSEKVDQIEHNPNAELCWYFTQTREQFRIGGEVSLVTADESDNTLIQVRQSAWENLSEKSRQQFAWPQPGEPRIHEGYDPVDLSDTPPLQTFGVLIFEPDAVDHLELKGEPQNRYLYWRNPDHCWEAIAVNP